MKQVIFYLKTDQPRSQGFSLEGGTHLQGKSPGNEVENW